MGSATPGEKVTVAIHDQTKTATADKDGRWTLKLDPEKAGGPFEMKVSGSNSLTVKNVLFGEVWQPKERTRELGCFSKFARTPTHASNVG